MQMPTCHTTCLSLLPAWLPAADLRRSAWCFGGWLCLFLPWMLLFMIAGSRLLGSAVYDKLDLYTNLDSADIGF